MTSVAPAASEHTWEREGAAARHRVAGASVVLVAGLDPAHTCSLTIGLARAECEARPVVIADLWGDLEELERFAGEGEGYGIADVLFFGASLNRVARHTPEGGAVRVVSSGNDIVANPTVFGAERWNTLFESARASHHLLLLVCRGDTDGLSDFAKRADAVLWAGADMPHGFPDSAVTINPAPLAAPFMDTRVQQSTALPPPGAAKPVASQLHRGVRHWPVLLLLLLAGVGATALLTSPAGRNALRMLAARITGGSGQPAPDAGDATAVAAAPRIINPGDSAVAAAYAVEIALLNTRAGAEIRLADLRDIPGSTVSPLLRQSGETWYRVSAGALAMRDSALLLEGQLQSRGLQRAQGENVARLPVAILLARHPPEHEAAAMESMARYISLGIPAYALSQTDGSLIIYAGAFESIAQAAHLGEYCSSVGVPPRFAYRTGR
jgi:hypothetical protein